MIDTINTERLLIKPIELNDLEDVFRYANDDSIDMMLFYPHRTIEATTEFINIAVTEWNKEEPIDREYVVVDNGTIIGGINIEQCGDREYELGWVIAKKYRGLGYATEAARALLDYAFNKLNATKVIAQCDNRNIASEKVMKKLGMTLIDDKGTREYPQTGVISGELLYAITKEEYIR